MKMKSWKN